MIELIQKGGYEIMIPLLILSILSFTFIMERIYRYIKIPNKVKATEFFKEVEGIIKNDDERFSSLQSFLKGRRGILPYIFSVVLERLEFLLFEERDMEDIRRELLITAEDNTRDYLEMFLPGLNTIATVAPLLGLLGTIIGMIESFAAISQQGVGDPQAVASGINEALLTTAAGLTVAIPSLLGYNLLRRRVEVHMKQLEPFENLFVNCLIHKLNNKRNGVKNA